MLITSTEIIEKEHPMPSYPQNILFLYFPWGTRLHGTSICCPGRPGYSSILLSDDIVTFESLL